MEDSQESEKMRAMRKAYVEIILNTAKEAAARVMVSERKAHQYHLHLSSTKDEAIRLLVRLKQSMECKINEVEMKSQDQQRKIEELEAQLQEAEDIVGSLRAELNEAQMKLDKWTKNQMCRGSNMTDNAHNENGSSQPGNKSCEAILASQKDKINHGAHGHSCANNYFEGPSIISRRKEPRIRTRDGNLLKDHLDHSKNVLVDDITCVKEEEHVDIKEVEGEEPVNIMQVLKLLRKRRKQGCEGSGYKNYNASSLERASRVTKEPCYDLSTSHGHDHDMHERDDKLTKVVNEDTKVASASGVGLDALGINTGLEMRNSTSLNLDVKLLQTSDGLSSPPSKDRVLKYTFQRKRKKESVVSDDNSLLNKESPLRTKMAKNQNGMLEPVISGEVTESLQGGRGMAQLARQLVSMSEKKWIK